MFQLPWSDTEVLVLVFAALGVLTIGMLAWIVRLEMKVRHLTKGASGKSLEDAIVSSRKRVEALEHFRSELEAYLAKAETRLRRSVQGVGTVRFNPFKGTGDGGNQSFAVGLINEKGDGVVVSSLYARERMSVFAKPLKDGVSEFELTEEEKEAVTKAKQRIS